MAQPPSVTGPAGATSSMSGDPGQAECGGVASATPPHSAWPGSPDIELVAPAGPVTDGGWAIEPAGLREALRAVVDGWSPPPLYLHEIGAAFDDDGPGEDGLVDDRARVVYLDAHLRAAADALADGVDLRGLFVWSLLDNFEWAEGYAHRFGIVHVDFATQRRTHKTSARWYAELLAAKDP